MTLFPLFFFFNDTATTEIYTLSLHDALPICRQEHLLLLARAVPEAEPHAIAVARLIERSEEHTSELQSPDHLVCRLLLEKKKKHILTVANLVLRMVVDPCATSPPSLVRLHTP